MARGGSRAGRNYTRDNSGRFSSTPGGGPPKRSTPASRRAAKPKRGALKPGGGTLTARARLKAARAKLTPGASRQQRAAVTRAQNRLKAAQAPVRMKTTATGSRARITKPRGMKRDPQAAAKLAALQQGRRGRQPNAKAQKAKAMANRTGVVKGTLRTDGQDTRTLSLAEMRRAVRQALRKGGIETRKQFEKAYGKPPTTRGGWEKLYRENVALPQSERNRKARPGVVNGVDIHKNYRPWQVFGLNPKTATRADVEAAFRRVAKQVHPDAGGRRRDFERVKKLRDSVLAQMPAPKGSKPSKGGKRGKASATAPAAPRGPLLLPPARDATPAKPARKRGATASTGGKGTAAKTKGERVLDRIRANRERGSRESTSKKQERKLAKTVAVAERAAWVVSRRAVGSRDPGKQYSKQELLPVLNESLSKPLPKKERKSTTRSKKDPTRSEIAAVAAMATMARNRARKKGALLSPAKPARKRTTRKRNP